MKEDMKILEEICNRPIQDTEGTKRMKQAIKNLINRNKELEEENKELLEIRISASAHNQIQELRRENQSYRDYYGNPPCYDDAKYIPKSKVKEKIEELKEQYKDYEKRWEKAGRNKAHPFYKYLIRIEAEIDILQELLEE